MNLPLGSRSGQPSQAAAAMLPSQVAYFNKAPEPQPTVALERLYRKQRLAVAYRVFSRLGYDHGGVGHITVRDPEQLDHFWVAPAGLHFSHIKVSDLMLCSHTGEIVEAGPIRRLNKAAFAIHSRLHTARSDVHAAAHAHSMYGKVWSTFGRTLDPITQDACIFYGDHGIYRNFGGVVSSDEEGDLIAAALGTGKAVILQHHGLLTVGNSVETAAWRYIAMENACQAQVLAQSAGRPLQIDAATAQATAAMIGGPYGEFQFVPYFEWVARDEPGVFE